MNKTVLVVDDSTFMRKRIKEQLTALGFTVLGEARDGGEAIELYNRLKPGLVTMDITMRGKDGLSASREILEMYPDAVIYIVTMLRESEYETSALKMGVRGFIHKDDLDQLSALLEKA
jgi:two-component system chemotaxis response regulator CheY